MAVDGVYGVVYGGNFALGAAVFRVTNGKVMGADHVGGRYIGTVTEDAAGNINMNVTFKAGVILAQGTDAQEVPFLTNHQTQVSATVRRRRAAKGWHVSRLGNGYDQAHSRRALWSIGHKRVQASTKPPNGGGRVS